ncbi:uncharacterized protein LOC114531031 [Dendronephthya gigantea]|uniref:uncharacterized protein LOC114531031 n=1 Tax=Dendronephthya gigantea TaxID=151771 RepID=UPI00106B18D1|nr:uncharacterized protein LOC114531031 [Dendronephthya gigantea]XP_028408466.1 uncharacterized protein LOC114531031 [Dendronephthya gigantea]XP_028408467.1 uncharacterized protein LOC114531031 [Dendronephthya gigantea]XP_028408468.1 uncharacterized protein LOC114531031 [Dendronephthya gigantea]XP_028408469.1 uncharacterized protein LOC114531031 [Dendronephthya gigantea]XP_028408470.1 uncharacterized protein LOC114531031 [Dendronephthya gigantea]XP_028408471.1 uncharacterized protein LOC11453
MGHSRRGIFFIGLICTMYLQKAATYYQYPSVYWAPKNCRFNLNKPPHKGYEFNIKPNGNLFFVCPNLALWDDMSSTGPRLSMMYENLMLVDKEGYETCTVNKTRNAPLNRLLLKCDQDAKNLKYMEETFSPNRAGPTQMRYKSGKTYYFISTSDGSKNSLDNLSGGHCETHNMKLKIKVCDHDEICPFIMPKCPYTYVFHRKRKTTTTASTTHAQTTETTLWTATEGKEQAHRNPSPTTQHKDTTVNIETEEKKFKKELSPTLTTASPTQPKVAKHSSNNTIWGSQRKHIIIHITMALLILVLTLSLVYILITKRNQPKPKRKEPPVAFSSKLYQERPTSTITIPLNLELNEDAQAL